MKRVNEDIKHMRKSLRGAEFNNEGNSKGGTGMKKLGCGMQFMK